MEKMIINTKKYFLPKNQTNENEISDTDPINNNDFILENQNENSMGDEIQYIYNNLNTDTVLNNITNQYSPSKMDQESNDDRILHLLNHADEKTLKDTFSKVGDKKAQNIIKYRNKYGLFTSIDQLDQIKGFGTKMIYFIKLFNDLYK